VKLIDETTNLRKIEAGVPEGSVLGPVLYLIYTRTSYLPSSDNTRAAAFADDRAILARNDELSITSVKVQATINKLNVWAKKWIMKLNQSKSTHISFTLRIQT
jgi:hypothetical protein